MGQEWLTRRIQLFSEISDFYRKYLLRALFIGVRGYLYVKELQKVWCFLANDQAFDDILRRKFMFFCEGGCVKIIWEINSYRPYEIYSYFLTSKNAVCD